MATPTDESEPLLLPPPPPPPPPQESSTTGNGSPHGRHARRLCVSHFLSTWNSRVFEFGAVLYLARIYSGTLLPMSIYAFARALSAVLLAPAVGMYIDTGDRLKVVRTSVVLQRTVVAASCAVFFVLLRQSADIGPDGRRWLFALLAVLACVEKLASIMNLVSVEKDWVIVVSGNDAAALRSLNAQMRRIDLICKLMGPFFIASIDEISTEIAILVNFALNAVSIGVEYFAIAKVYAEVPELQQPKPSRPRSSPAAGEPESRIAHNWRHVQDLARRSVGDFAMYTKHAAFMPSIAGALLYFTVLNFGGQMVTFLLSSGYQSFYIGIARACSVSFEVAATWLAPWLMAKLGTLRAGLWLSNWQVFTLLAGLTLFWIFLDDPTLSATALIAGTAISRIGLRGFDLCVQVLVQNEVEAGRRGAFSSVEAAWQSGFELLSFMSTMVFSRPQDFKWPSLLSLIAIATASAIYAAYSRSRRRHLLHTEIVMQCIHGHKQPQSALESGVTQDPE